MKTSIHSENSPYEENVSFFDERALWRNEIKTGIVNRKVIGPQIIITKRVLNAYSVRLEDIIYVRTLA
jgi:hypothetical protein